MIRQLETLSAILLFLVAAKTTACEQCKCQGANPVESLSTNLQDAYKTGNQPEDKTKTAEEPARTKWCFDTLFEFTSYAHVNLAEANHIVDTPGRDTHGHINEYDITQRFAYNVTSDLQV